MGPIRWTCLLYPFFSLCRRMRFLIVAKTTKTNWFCINFKLSFKIDLDEGIYLYPFLFAKFDQYLLGTNIHYWNGTR